MNHRIRFVWALLMFLMLTPFVTAAKYISDDKLWSHVITIDRLAWMNHQDQDVSPIVDDEKFVRRAYLDVVGMLPTYEQAREFLDSKKYSKRSQLIDMLLQSPGYVSHYFNLFADLLRVPRNNDLNFGSALNFMNDTNDYAIWLKEQLFKNTTYDEIVRELITAEGMILENPASFYYVRDMDVFDSVNSTTKSLLGKRIGCAQCHNHRFDKWTQKEFYEFAAFFQVRKGKFKKLHPGTTNPHGYWANVKRIWSEDDLETKYSPKEKNDVWTLLIPPTYGPEIKHANLKFPVGYAYDNGMPGQVVEPRIVFEDLPSQLVGETRREQVANWITSKNNKMFSKVMANRLWKKVFGVGLVEPVDDWKDNTPVLNPELMEALADIFIDVEYDLKAFLTILYNTEAYQMSVNGKKELMIKNYKIQGAMLRRMTAEQIWDSLLTLGVGPRSVYRDDVHEGAFDYHEKRRDFMIGFVKGGVDIVENYKGIEIYKGNVDEFKDYIRSYIPKALEFSSQYKIIESWKIPVLNEATAHPRIVATSASLKNLKRASDGNKKESSFVKLFGASKREQTVHGGSLAANLVQPLELLNGSTIKQMTSTGSYIMQRIMLEKSNKRKLEVLTYSLFSRKPSSKEFSILKKHLNLESQQKSEEEKWQSFLIAFINSPEFIFIQ